MRRRTALVCAVALAVMGATTTSAFAAKGGTPGPPQKGKSAEMICEKRGGLFVNVSPLVYACVFPDRRHQGRNQAERVCEKQGGLFVDVSPLIYACVLPGGTLTHPILIPNPPNPTLSDRAERICEARGGLFVDVSPVIYACVFPDRQHQGRNQARRTCQRQGGLFVDVSPLIYACVLPGGTLPNPFPQLPQLP